MLITLMVLVVARKSRTFFSFPCSADELVCRDWEGAKPGSQPKIADIIFHTIDACSVYKWGWPGGRNSLFILSLNFHEFNVFSMSSVSSVKIANSAKSMKSAKSAKSVKSACSASAAWGLAMQSVVEG